MPTLLELAGGTYPEEFNGHPIKPLEGRSLLPLLRGATRPQSIYVWEHEGNRAIREGDYKLVNRFGSDWELFDMHVDRLEADDLAARMPEKVRQMAALYQREAARIGIVPWSGAQTEIGWPDDPVRWSR
jgi:arylsulfatase